MSALSNHNIARAIYLFSKENGSYQQIVQFLARKRLLGKSSEILSQLRKIVNQDKGIIEAEISGARTLRGEAKGKLEEFLVKRYTGKQVIFKEKIDEKLLGGFRIEVNDEVIDLTLKNKIFKLEEYLTRST